MAILGFHFSKDYKKPLLAGTKTATVMLGEHKFKIGQVVQVYVSNKPNLLAGVLERRIGQARITKLSVKPVKKLTLSQAQACGANNLAELNKALKKWYNVRANTKITFIRFRLKLI